MIPSSNRRAGFEGGEEEHIGDAKFAHEHEQLNGENLILFGLPIDYFRSIAVHAHEAHQDEQDTYRSHATYMNALTRYS